MFQCRVVSYRIVSSRFVFHVVDSFRCSVPLFRVVSVRVVSCRFVLMRRFVSFVSFVSFVPFRFGSLRFAVSNRFVSCRVMSCRAVPFGLIWLGTASFDSLLVLVPCSPDYLSLVQLK